MYFFSKITTALSHSSPTFRSSQCSQVDSLLVIQWHVLLVSFRPTGHPSRSLDVLFLHHVQMVGHVQSCSHNIVDSDLVSPRYIRSQSNLHFGIQQALDIAQPGAQIRIGTWTMRNRGAPLAEDLQFLILQVHPMGHHATTRQKLSLIVDVRVVLVLREELLHCVDLPQVLGNVRLDVQIVPLRQVSQLLEQLHVASDREPWCDDRFYSIQILLQDVLDELDVVFNGRLRSAFTTMKRKFVIFAFLRVETVTQLHVVVRAQSIRRYLAHESSLTLTNYFVRQHLIAIIIDGGEVASTSGTTCKRITHYGTVNLFGEINVLVLRLQRERVGLEPSQQIFVQSQANVGRLWSVDMAIDETRK